MRSIQFTVNGRPLTQGSMTPMRNRHTGKMFMQHKKGLVEWRHLIGDVAFNKMKEGYHSVTSGPVRVHVQALMVRPKKHYRTGKYSHILRDDAPMYHIQAPDGDKLMRAVMDALTDIVYRDDSQVFDEHLVKEWIGRDETPGIIVSVSMIEEWD